MDCGNWESSQFPNGVFDPSQIPNIQISTQLTPYRYDSQAFHRTTNKKQTINQISTKSSTRDGEKSTGNSGSGKILPLFSQINYALCNDYGVYQADIKK